MPFIVHAKACMPISTRSPPPLRRRASSESSSKPPGQAHILSKAIQLVILQTMGLEDCTKLARGENIYRVRFGKISYTLGLGESALCTRPLSKRQTDSCLMVAT